MTAVTSDSIFGKKYRILKRLGKGGFATVYLAEDITLDRKVALKVLDPELSDNDPTFLKRFELEAKTAARLNHANIIGIYEFGQENDQYFIVMPYLSGFDLARRIRRHGVLETTQVTRIAEQVGAALDYAHRQGVVHRDVKPSNVIFNEHGQAVLTDFGIAKLADKTANTRTGDIIGTAHYMAPEQWRAEQVDSRTDLYALGVMIYEMLTGQMPFSGQTPHRIMYAHLNETPPPPHTLNSELPPAIEKVLLKMLAKAPEERYENAWHFCADLKAALVEPPEVGTSPEKQPDPPQIDLTRPSAEPPSLPPAPEVAPPPVPIKADVYKQPAKSGWIVFAVVIMISIAISLGIQLFFNPTGREFISSIIGGASTPTLTVESTGIFPTRPGGVVLATPTPSPIFDGRITFVSDRDGNNEIYVIANGTKPVNLTNNAANDLFPAWSPNGQQIAFASNRDGNREIYVMNANGTNPVNLTNNAADDWSPAWSPDGTRIAFSTDITSSAIVKQFSLLSEIYVSNTAVEFCSIFAISVINANEMNSINLTNNGWSPAWSFPDGQQIAFASTLNGSCNKPDIYIMDANGANPINLTNNAAHNGEPVWSPDGTRIAFTSDRDGNSEIYVMNANGMNPINLTNNEANDSQPAWTQ